MKTFNEFLVEKTLPSTVQKVITELEDDDAKLLDVTSTKREYIHTIFVKYDNGDYKVISVVDNTVSKRDMEPSELRRYKTAD